MDPDERRLSFNRVAKAYDRYRPSYPAALIEHVERTARLDSRSRLLEIGCGPGKATLLFAERGYEILCIEPGTDLIGIAAGKLRGYPVSFVNCMFEEWQETTQAFDLVYSAQAFHWVKKDVGYAKAARALRPGGYLGLLSTHSDHIVLSPERLECVLKGLGEVIERFGGSLELHYSTVLYVARKQG